MAKIKWRGGEIKGHLDIIVADNEDEFDGEITKWQEVLIHGDADGLKSFAKLLMKIANLDQETQIELPVGAREHYHLRPNLELGKSSVETIVGRLDAKGTGKFYDRFVPKEDRKHKPRKT
jgi:hypothetical protein